MIGMLNGTLLFEGGETAYVETAGGVGYELYVHPELLAKQGEQVRLYTYLNVREQELTLFGFEARKELSMFRMLLEVDGVGPKTAFGIMIVGNNDDIHDAVVKSDVAYFQSMKGIGKKTAQKIVVELASRVNSDVDISKMQESQEDRDAIDALIALGFERTKVKEAVAKLDTTLTTEVKITQAIKELAERRT